MRARLEEQLNSHVSGIRSGIQPFADFSEKQVGALDKLIEELFKSLHRMQGLEKKLSQVEMKDVSDEKQQ